MSATSTYQMKYFTSNLYNFYGDWFLIFLSGGLVFLIFLLFYRFFRSKWYKL